MIAHLLHHDWSILLRLELGTKGIGFRIFKHASSKEKDMNKLTIFLQWNKNAPYAVRKVVFDACFNSFLLYGCELWLGTNPIGTLNSLSLKAVKMLLGVQQLTTNDACLLENSGSINWTPPEISWSADVCPQNDQIGQPEYAQMYQKSVNRSR